MVRQKLKYFISFIQFLFVQMAGSPIPAPVFGSTGFQFISQLATRLSGVVGPSSPPPRQSSAVLPDSDDLWWRLGCVAGSNGAAQHLGVIIE